MRNLKFLVLCVLHVPDDRTGEPGFENPLGSVRIDGVDKHLGIGVRVRRFGDLVTVDVVLRIVEDEGCGRASAGGLVKDNQHSELLLFTLTIITTNPSNVNTILD